MSYASPSASGPRLIGLGLVILMHAGVIYALQSGLARSVVEVIRGPIETKIIEEVKPKDDEPPPPPPKFDEPPPFVPPPEIAIDIPMDTSSTTAITNVQSTIKTPPAKPAPKIVMPQSTKRNSQPEYPPTSRRMSEQGTVILLMYIMENGRVGDVKIDKSSGYQRLDDAAEREARRSWRFIPGTEDGKPKPMWMKIAVTFRLTD